VLGSVVLASATSWAVLRLLLGNDPLFKVPQYELVSPAEFLIYAVLGLLGGLLSVAFTKSLLKLPEHFLRLRGRQCGFSPPSGEWLSASWAGSCRKRSEWATATSGKC
jgi:CIC family chloride channel protein